MYYQLEERALRAMLLSLTPGASEPGATEPSKRIAELEQRVVRASRSREQPDRRDVNAQIGPT
jgi:hypothetical protein